MKSVFTIFFVALAGLVILTGCAGTGKAMTDSASAKNLGLDGYVMYGTVETNNPETATPQGKLIIGRLTYKSRKVGIPADQKVPNTGNFKATKTKSLFGTEELIIEYDWTAGSDAENKSAEERLQKMKEQAEKAASEIGNESDSEKESGAAQSSR